MRRTGWGDQRGALCTGFTLVLFLNMDATILFYFALANKVIYKVRRLGGRGRPVLA